MGSATDLRWQKKESANKERSIESTFLKNIGEKMKNKQHLRDL